MFTQIKLFFENQVSGKSINEGKIIFNIGEGLGFGHSLFRMYLRWKLTGLIRLQLHRLRIRE